MYLNCIDYEKAFDSIYPESRWAILHRNGIPQKIINLIKALYSDFHCKVIHEGSLTEPFLVNSGVKQGCLLSPFLFLLSLDWVMKESLAGQQLGIRWTIVTKLDDLE